MLLVLICSVHIVLYTYCIILFCLLIMQLRNFEGHVEYVTFEIEYY